MQKTRDMNHEIIRKRLIEIYQEYTKSKSSAASITKMKEVVKEYDDVIELLDETLNCAFGIMEAITKKEIKDKKEEDQIVSEMTKELENKSYLGVTGTDETSEDKTEEISK